MNIVKYPGGKERELNIIREYFPLDIENYYEPFVGGGAVYLDIQAKRYFINDFSKNLMNLYRCIAENNKDFYMSMDEINTLWKSIDKYYENEKEIYNIYINYRDGKTNDEQVKEEIITYIKENKEKILNFIVPMNCGHTEEFLYNLTTDIYKKMKRMKELNFNKKVIPEEDIHKNLLGIFKASFYMYIRNLYDHTGHYTNGFKAMLYLFIRDFCYSSMFRYNASGNFNVPYGGISYNTKTYDNTKEKYLSKEIQNKMNRTVLGCMDYREFLYKYPPNENDFMFIDPPYDSDFNTYDNKDFDAQEQEKLANYLLNRCSCRFMVDIKYTNLIGELYKEGEICKNGEKLTIVPFEKKYSVSFMNRNIKNSSHILIMNYKEGLC